MIVGPLRVAIASLTTTAGALSAWIPSIATALCLRDSCLISTAYLDTESGLNIRGCVFSKKPKKVYKKSKKNS